MDYPTFTMNGTEHVIIPLDEFKALTGANLNADTYENPDGWTSLPQDVAEWTILENMGPLKAWRKHFKLTQEELAGRMGINRNTYKTYEKSEKPRKLTLIRAAEALGIEARQLIEMYDDEPASIPVGYVPPSPEELD